MNISYVVIPILLIMLLSLFSYTFKIEKEIKILTEGEEFFKMKVDEMYELMIELLDLKISAYEKHELNYSKMNSKDELVASLQVSRIKDITYKLKRYEELSNLEDLEKKKRYLAKYSENIKSCSCSVCKDLQKFIKNDE